MHKDADMIITRHRETVKVPRKRYDNIGNLNSKTLQVMKYHIKVMSIYISPTPKIPFTTLREEIFANFA